MDPVDLDYELLEMLSGDIFIKKRQVHVAQTNSRENLKSQSLYLYNTEAVAFTLKIWKPGSPVGGTAYGLQNFVRDTVPWCTRGIQRRQRLLASFLLSGPSGTLSKGEKRRDLRGPS